MPETSPAPAEITPEAPQPEAAKAPEATEQAAPPAVDTGASKYSSKLAALAKKERRIVEREKKLKEATGKTEGLSELNELIAIAKDDPKARLKLLEKTGLTVDDIVRAALEADQPEDAGTKALKEVERLRKEREEEAQKAKEAEEKRLRDEEEKNLQRVKGAFDDYKTGLTQFFKDNPEEYSAIHAEDAFDLVSEVVETHALKTLEQTGKADVLSFKEAADAVEKQLRSEIPERARRYKSLKWLSEVVDADSDNEAPKTPTKADGQDTKKPSPTLTNKTSGVPRTATEPAEMTTEERKLRARALLKKGAKENLARA